MFEMDVEPFLVCESWSLSPSFEGKSHIACLTCTANSFGAVSRSTPNLFGLGSTLIWVGYQPGSLVAAACFKQ